MTKFHHGYVLNLGLICFVSETLERAYNAIATATFEPLQPFSAMAVRLDLSIALATEDNGTEYGAVVLMKDSELVYCGICGP
jgi:hypothetical protein